MEREIYQYTQTERKIVARTEFYHCWIELQCHSCESIRGWAFRVGGNVLQKGTEWQYGYPSEAEARKVAIDLVEELLKHRIRETERILSMSQTLLSEINEKQRTMEPSI